MPLGDQMSETIELGMSYNDAGAAGPAVPAVGAASWDVALSSKGKGSVSTVTGLNGNGDFINEEAQDVAAGLRRGLYRDSLFSPAGGKYDGAGCGCEERVVAPFTYVGSGMKPGAPLPHDDLSGLYQLSAETLYAETLCVRIAAVL